MHRRKAYELGLAAGVATVAAVALVSLVSQQLAGATTGPARPSSPTAPASSHVHAAVVTHASTSALRFSRMVIVDEQRPGNEPDVKVNPTGQIFSSEPFGFSTASSFLWRSGDHGRSYQLVPGNIGTGKPSTCAGGGDTDLYIDPSNALYFSDLQGLTNISNSVSTDGGKTFKTTCSGAPNSPVDRMWFAAKGNLKKGNLSLYQDYDQTGTSAGTDNPGGNQLVETVSTDGTTFLPVLNTNVNGTNCAGTAPNCVTDNEGISGNQVVDPRTGNVFIAHTTINGASSSTPGVQVSEGRDQLYRRIGNRCVAREPEPGRRIVPEHAEHVRRLGEEPDRTGGRELRQHRPRQRGLSVRHVHRRAARPQRQQCEPRSADSGRTDLRRAVTTPATMTNPASVTWSKPIRITGPSRGISAWHEHLPVDHRRLARPRRRGLVPHRRAVRARLVSQDAALPGLRRVAAGTRRVDGAERADFERDAPTRAGAGQPSATAR